MLDIIGLGDSNVDLIIKVDHIAGHDEKVRGKLLGKYPGGIIGNFCCAAAKFGVRSGIMSTIGDDEFGQICIDGYREFGVDTGGLIIKPGESTYFCVVYLDASGEKALTIAETPLLVPQATDIMMDYIRQARFHMKLGSNRFFFSETQMYIGYSLAVVIATARMMMMPLIIIC